MVDNPIEEINLRIKEFQRGNVDFISFMKFMSKYNKLLFYFQKRVQETDISKIEIDENGIIFSFLKYGVKFLIDKSCRSAALEYLTFGEYERKELNFLLSIIKDGDSILDIGAHIGWYSLIFGKQFLNSKIYAFEPVDKTFQLLSNNVAMNNLSNIIIQNYGLWDKNDLIKFNFFEGGAVLSSPANLIDHQTSLKTCQVRTMDQAVKDLKIDKVDIIKCDIEGCELFALKGGVETIIKNKPLIFIELYEPWFKKMGYNFIDLHKFMKKLGYSLFSVNENQELTREGQSIENRQDYNFFYLHNKKHSKIIKNFVT